MTSLSYISVLLPTIALSLWVGRLLDRYPRWTILQSGQILFGIAAGVSAVSIASLVDHPLSLWWLCPFLAGLSGLAMALVNPARLALIGDLTRGRTLEANTVLINLENILTLGLAPVACAALKSTYGWSSIYLVIALLVSTAIITLIPVRLAAKESRSVAKGPTDLGSSLAVLRSLELGPSLILATAATTATLGVVQVLLPQFSLEVLELSEIARGVLMSRLALGLFLGTLLGGLLNRRSFRGRMILGSLLLSGCATCLFSEARTLVAAEAIITGGGIFGGFSAALVVSALQSATPDQARGTVMGLYSLAFQGAPLLGAVAAGFFAELIGTQIALVVMGGIVFVCASAIAMSQPSLRSYR